MFSELEYTEEEEERGFEESVGEKLDEEVEGDNRAAKLGDITFWVADTAGTELLYDQISSAFWPNSTNVPSKLTK